LRVPSVQRGKVSLCNRSDPVGMTRIASVECRMRQSVTLCNVDCFSELLLLLLLLSLQLTCF